MKLCKKLFSFILVLSIMLSSVSAFAAPNANESGINEYNLAPGTTVICVEAFVLGWGYVLEPTVVAYNPGETLAQLTARVLAANSLACVMNGAADDDAITSIASVSPALNFSESSRISFSGILECSLRTPKKLYAFPHSLKE